MISQRYTPVLVLLCGLAACGGDAGHISAPDPDLDDAHASARVPDNSRLSGTFTATRR